MDWLAAAYVAISLVLTAAVQFGHAREDLTARQFWHDVAMAWCWPVGLPLFWWRTRR